MSSFPILTRFNGLWGRLQSQPGVQTGLDLHNLYLHPEQLPMQIRSLPEVQHCLNLLGPLAWDAFPERDLQRNWGQESVPYAAFAAACLWKIDQQMSSLSHLVGYLDEHSALAWMLGFRSPQVSNNAGCTNFAPALPSSRHFPRLLHKLPNVCLQFLLDSSIQELLAEFARRKVAISEVVCVDTKHILAWVKENNPKAYIQSDRFNKEKQPAGDPDCKLGCKRRHNRRASSQEPPAQTPTSNPVPADTISVGEYYWGYASGVVALKVPGWGEFVLAEFTQPFNRADVSYFFPLMAMVEQRLGHKPRLGALDAAYDAWYIYDYFHREDDPGAFAAVPFSERGGLKDRRFTPQGDPLCAAEIPMFLRYTFTSRTGAFEHPEQRYGCPLLLPEPTAQECPKNHANFAKGGCTATLVASVGARLRYTLDRNSQQYKDVYKQRTAVERIFSQAKALGIEHPHLRNGQAIANWNTLIYTVLNLRLLRRIRQQP